MHHVNRNGGDDLDNRIIVKWASNSTYLLGLFRGPNMIIASTEYGLSLQLTLQVRDEGRGCRILGHLVTLSMRKRRVAPWPGVYLGSRHDISFSCISLPP